MWFPLLLIFIFCSVVYSTIIIKTKYVYFYAVNLTLVMVMLINYLNYLDRDLIRKWLDEYKVLSMEKL